MTLTCTGKQQIVYVLEHLHHYGYRHRQKMITATYADLSGKNAIASAKQTR